MACDCRGCWCFICWPWHTADLLHEQQISLGRQAKSSKRLTAEGTLAQALVVVHSIADDLQGMLDAGWLALNDVGAAGFALGRLSPGLDVCACDLANVPDRLPSRSCKSSLSAATWDRM